MSNQLVQVCSKRVFDFNNIAASQTGVIIIENALDVTPYFSATLAVSVHSKDIVGTGDGVGISFQVFGAALSHDAPGIVFIRNGSTSETPLGKVELTSSTPGLPDTGIFGSNTAVLATDYFSLYAPALRIHALGKQGSSSVHLSATVSIDLILNVV